MEILAALLLIALLVRGYSASAKQLSDPTDYQTVYVDQVRSLCQIRPGPVAAALMRQSGHLYRDLGYFDSADDAIYEIEKAFRRGKIEAVFITKNTSEELRMRRLFHSHRGRAEGKKLGGAIIVAEE